MKISVFVKAAAREEKVEKISETEFKVSVKAPAKEGRANWAVERVVAEHFGVSPSRVRIISGQTAKKKIIEVI